MNLRKKMKKPTAHSWYGDKFKGKVNKKNWIESSIIGLDFDTRETPIKELFKEFKEYGITPNLHYDTFS